jgi:hypothetical protein
MVRRRDQTTFVASPKKVAVECGFYDVRDMGGNPSAAVELVLADLDGSAIDAIRRIDKLNAPPTEGTQDRLNIAIFLALQLTRTPEQRERVEFPARVAKYAGAVQYLPI